MQAQATREWFRFDLCLPLPLDAASARKSSGALCASVCDGHCLVQGSVSIPQADQKEARRLLCGLIRLPLARPKTERIFAFPGLYSWSISIFAILRN